MIDISLNYERQFSTWRSNIVASQKLRAEVVDELEDHLCVELEELDPLDITEDEKFMLAKQRMGDMSAVENEFYKLERHKRWLQQITVMLGGYILLTLLFQFIRAIATALGSMKLFTQISQMLGAQIYIWCSIALLALFAHILWRIAQRRSPLELLGYTSANDGSLQKVLQGTICIILIVTIARLLDGFAARQMSYLLFSSIDMFEPINPMVLTTSFAFIKNSFEATTMPFLMILTIVVLIALIRHETDPFTKHS